MFVLNPQSGIPIYRQILEQARRMVASGQLAPGAELPSVRELAVKHAVNPMTISKAYSLLEAEGLLERNRGMPMTVASQSRNASPLTKRLQQVTAAGRADRAGGQTTRIERGGAGQEHPQELGEDDD